MLSPSVPLPFSLGRSMPRLLHVLSMLSPSASLSPSLPFSLRSMPRLLALLYMLSPSVPQPLLVVPALLLGSFNDSPSPCPLYAQSLSLPRSLLALLLLVLLLALFLSALFLSAPRRPPLPAGTATRAKDPTPPSALPRTTAAMFFLSPFHLGDAI